MRINIGPYEESRVVDIRIDPWDTWNMDHTLSLIIIPMLEQLRDTNHGHPSELTDQEWIDIQNQMIRSFEQIRDEKVWDLPLEKMEEHGEEVQKGLDLFSKYFRNLWD